MGPCAKKVVRCTLVSKTGWRFVGENLCVRPQLVCPRLPGEGYGKCTSVCEQPRHAEIAALLIAGDRARGTRAYIEGISHVCRACQEAMTAAGVQSFTLGEPPQFSLD